MKAVVLKGKQEPFVIEEVEIPTLASDEVLVRVKAAAFNHRDLWIQKGLYAGLKFPIILGSDGSGIVEKVGDEANKSWIGESVIINPSTNWGDSEAFQQKEFTILGLPENGTFAQFVKVKFINIHKLPSYLSFEEAAALPLTGLTSYRALFSRAGLKAGEKVLIVGVGGGAASMALKWALAAKAEVYVTSGSQEKIDYAKSLGAIDGVNYKTENWLEALEVKAGGFDVILDSALGDGFASLLDLANPGGRIVFFGGTAGNIPELNGRKIFWKQLSILGTTMGSNLDFSKMLDFADLHKIKPVIDSVYPLEEAEQAIQKMKSGSQFGKIVLKVD